MKVVLLGDVHANSPALEATLAHARHHQVDSEREIASPGFLGIMIALILGCT